MDIPKESNELLRSAYQIALRDGKDTNWEAFQKSVLKELLYQAGVPKEYTEQMVLRATCTARTYRDVLNQYDSQNKKEDVCQTTANNNKQ